jgi:hypothetical protein
MPCRTRGTVLSTKGLSRSPSSCSMEEMKDRNSLDRSNSDLAKSNRSVSGSLHPEQAAELGPSACATRRNPCGARHRSLQLGDPHCSLPRKGEPRSQFHDHNLLRHADPW